MVLVVALAVLNPIVPDDIAIVVIALVVADVVVTVVTDVVVVAAAVAVLVAQVVAVVVASVSEPRRCSKMFR